MRVVLPGGVRVDWSPDEAADAIRILTQALLSAATGRESGLILANPQIVRYDDRHVRLTPTQFALVRFIQSHGPSDFDTAKDSVWLGKDISDANLRKVCSDTSTAMFDAGIPWKLSAKGGFIELVKEL